MSALTPVSFSKSVARKPRLSPPSVPGRRDERFWTDDEVAILREFYPTGGLTACLIRLPSRAGRRIYAKAHALGLKCQGNFGGPRRHRTTAEKQALEAAVRDAWPALRGRGAVQDLADRLGAPRHTVSEAARRLGLTMPHRKEPPWTAAEINLLGKAPLHDPDHAAEVFRAHGFSRTPTSISVKATRLQISRRRHETLTARAVAKILGLDSKTVGLLCVAGELKASRCNTHRLPQQGGDMWAITPADLSRYVVEHLDRIDIRKVEKFAFVDLLLEHGRDRHRSEGQP